MVETQIAGSSVNESRGSGVWVWIALLAVILFAGAIRIRLLDAPLERDEGEYAYAGQLILQGILPYQAPSLYKYKLPGIYFVYALIIGLFGETQSGVHAGLLVANIATVILLFLLAKRLFGPIAGLVTGATYAIVSVSTSTQGVFAHAEHFVVLAVVAGVLLLLSALDCNSYWKLFFSGVLLGLAYVVRQHGAGFVLFGAVYFIWDVIKRMRDRWKTVVLRFLVFCLGVVFLFLLICVVLFIGGVFEKFWFWTFDYARKYVIMMPYRVGVESFFKQLARVITPSILIWLLAGWGFCALLRHKKHHTNQQKEKHHTQTKN